MSKVVINQTSMTMKSELARSVMEMYGSTELWRCEYRTTSGDVVIAASGGTAEQAETKATAKLEAEIAKLEAKLATLREVLR